MRLLNLIVSYTCAVELLINLIDTEYTVRSIESYQSTPLSPKAFTTFFNFFFLNVRRRLILDERAIIQSPFKIQENNQKNFSIVVYPK